jgi:hypothetical protein
MSANNLPADYIKVATINKITGNDIINPFFHVGLTVEHIAYSGMDSDLSIAIKKAISEMAEGLYFHSVKKKTSVSRSGLAAHVSEFKAKDKAYQELVERDAFIMHYLHPELANEVRLKKEDENFKYTVNKLQTVDPFVDVMLATIYNKKDHSYFMGLSSGDSRDELIQKSMQEAFMLETNWIKKTENHKQTEKAELLNRHFEIQFQDDVKQAIQKILSGGNKDKLNFVVENQKTEFKLSQQFQNRIIADASHPDLMALTFGDLWQSSKDKLQQQMKARNLDITHWNDHPLL